MSTSARLMADAIDGLADSEQRKVKPPVLVVATEWFAENGGLSVFNQWFCGWLSKNGFDVWCYVPHVDEVARSHAKENRGCSLVSPRGEGFKQLQYLHRDAQLLAQPDLPPGIEPRVIFGHDRTTGIHARLLREKHFTTAKLAQVIHMHPEDSQKYRPDREGGEQKKAAQVCCVDGADLILGVGPKLKEHAENLARNAAPRVFMVVPDASILGRAPGNMEKVPFGYVNFTGRLEDSEQKGLTLLGNAWKKLKTKRLSHPKPQIVVRGTHTSEAKELDKLFGEKAICRHHGISGDWRTTDLEEADLAVMPSRGEGFGLVALEAVYCNTPVLLNGDSGFAQLVEASWPACPAIVKDPTPKEWCIAMERVLRDPTKHFAQAIELRTKLQDYLAIEQIESKALAAINALL